MSVLSCILSASLIILGVILLFVSGRSEDRVTRNCTRLIGVVSILHGLMNFLTLIFPVLLQPVILPF